MDENFNPRSPRGERPGGKTRTTNRKMDFNPRSPRGERQSADNPQCAKGHISIHAPRGGSDFPFVGDDKDIFFNFNPRSPRGERLYLPLIHIV